jgi:hypothetical protein
MALQSPNRYPIAPLSTTVPVPVSSTTAAEIASLALYDNTEVDVIQIRKAANSLMTTLMALGRRYDGEGEYEDMSVSSEFTSNFPEVRWMEQDDETLEYTANAAAIAVVADADVTLTFTTTVGLGAGTQLRNVTTNEQVIVLSVPTATTVVVRRNLIGTAAVTSSDKFQVIGSAIAGGVASVDSFGSVAVTKSNFIQKFVDTLITTDFDQYTPKVGADKRKANDILVANTTIKHKEKLEKALLLGRKASYATASGTVYTMGGVLEHAGVGFTTDLSSGGLTVAKLEEWLSTVSQYTKGSSTTKVLLCGTRVRSALSGLWYTGQVRTENIENINLKIEKVVLSGGFEYIIVDSPFMDDMSGYSKMAAVVDPAYIKFLYPQGSNQNGTFDGKTRMVLNTAETNHAKEVLDVVTLMSMKLQNANAFGLARLVA